MACMHMLIPSFLNAVQTCIMQALSDSPIFPNQGPGPLALGKAVC